MRISNKTKRRFKKRIRDVIRRLSRSVVVYGPTLKSECPNCFFDKFTNKSINKCKWTSLEAQAKQLEWESLGNSSIRYKFFLKGRCPVCRGNGFLEKSVQNRIDCLVTWDPKAISYSNTESYSPAGAEGLTYVQLKTHPQYFELFKDCIGLEVDGLDCKITRAPILRGIGTQAVLVIIASTHSKLKNAGNELVKNYR